MFSELAKGWVMVVYLSVTGTALAYGLYYYGIHHTSAQGGSMSFFLKPVIASVLGVVFMGDDITVRFGVATVLVFTALMLRDGSSGNESGK